MCLSLLEGLIEEVLCTTVICLSTSYVHAHSSSIHGLLLTAGLSEVKAVFSSFQLNYKLREMSMWLLGKQDD